MTGSEVPPTPFRLAYVPGATPAKWVRIWNERLPDTPLDLIATPAAEVPDVLRRGDADAGLVRLPVDRTYFSAIPLYTETTVVVIPKDHLIAAFEEVTLADLADEVVFHPLDDTFEWENGLPGRPAIERPATTGDAIELVAANVGVLLVPQSLARLHHRKDLTYRTVTDGPQSSVALSWPEERTTDMVEDFIGIVRGRTVNSSRGRRPGADESKDQRKEKRPEAGAARRKPATGKAAGRSGTGTKGARGASGGSRSGASRTGKRGKPGRRG
ncbi:LysR family transcriptional regulator substrate-binding protein [Streptomyces hesseae]|uniref:LysR family transcriptional regulator substrate-binding protein n=1 Tax=Streptomyces hesseae TaxID=3075519 RepID=A0ABU2SFU6_9ACTN|nr:LysR family transcriptional regulator substrate-binding protein [Streptomyces sp. DSM 40473]MDT0447496.1 LysR family transcriptional regulator substrate-binding protein [Streptomyces sp. DSM 40473]